MYEWNSAKQLSSWNKNLQLVACVTSWKNTELPVLELLEATVHLVLSLFLDVRLSTGPSS